MSKEKTTAIYLDVVTRDIAKEQAKKNGMTLKGYIRKLVDDAEKMDKIIKAK